MRYKLTDYEWTAIRPFLPNTCYNRFVRWRRAGVWDQIMDALAAGHDPAVQMIDTFIVRVHQPACVKRNPAPSNGTVTRRLYEQNPCGGR